MTNIEDIKKNFNNIECDLIDIKQHFNDMIECILYDDLERELTLQDIERIKRYRVGIRKCYKLIEIINEGDIK